MFPLWTTLILHLSVLVLVERFFMLVKQTQTKAEYVHAGFLCSCSMTCIDMILSEV